MFFSKLSEKILLNSIIIYATKIGKSFYLYKFEIGNNNVKCDNISLGKQSRNILYEGSGALEFHDGWLKFNKKEVAFNEAHTSRGEFRCIYDVINGSNNKFVGGKMQAAVLYRGHDVPHPVGIYYENECYLFGQQMKTDDYNNDKIEYRNNNFEIVDCSTGMIADGAQRQPFANRQN